ncbi:DUF3667 domain-containing protein [uncultured Psychroserpens sp.]|uniref:DUF3667 domain-containing protein n=1 Tax=uncultured Psychroserpens sp. TaxID=255436 RepID=UPI00260B5BBB|nr:DUF3667 domain-containing protein [uncultured Psychroserpens sp.]
MTCKNCNTTLNEQINYCPLCGAKIVKKRLSMKTIAADINEQFFNLDNKLLKTFIHLFTKPEVVIEGFINGIRKKYISVIQFFAISLTLVGIQVFLMNTFFREAMELDPNMFGPMMDSEAQKNNPFRNFEYADYNNYQSVFYVLSIPFSAISTYLTYWISDLRRFNFTEHLVINLYYSAQIIIINAFVTIVLLCFGVNFMLISFLSTLFILIYFFHVLKRVFNTSLLMTFVHLILVMIILGFIFIVLIVLVSILGYFLGRYVL